jgi:tetratricopeptide (TPR) repeat protein
VKLSFSAVLLTLAVADPSGEAAQLCNQFENPAKQIQGCTEYIRQASAPGPNLAIAYINRGIAYASQRQFRRAIADFNEAIRLAPDSPLPYYNRANTHFDRKDYKQAIADFTAAIERDPTLALAYYNRALAYEKLSNRAKAIADLQKALELDPDSVTVKSRLRKLGVSN